MSQDRGQGIHLPAPQVGIPTRVFLFTMDQIATMLSMQEATIRRKYIYYEGRTTGPRSKAVMVARNIALPDEPPEWRVAEREFVRWMKHKGFRHYERGAFGT